MSQPALNKVFIIGRLAHHPKVKNVGKGKKVASFTMAVPNQFGTRSGEQIEQVEYIDCEAWNDRANVVGTYLKQGSFIHIEGNLKVNEWTDPKKGGKRYKMLVNVHRITFLETVREQKRRTPRRERYPGDDSLI